MSQKREFELHQIEGVEVCKSLVAHHYPAVKALHGRLTENLGPDGGPAVSIAGLDRMLVAALFSLGLDTVVLGMANALEAKRN